jgi:hypothetical protein
VFGVIAGAALVSSAILFEFPVDRITLHGSSLPQPADPVLKAAAQLNRTDAEYGERIETMQNLLTEKLAHATDSRSAKDDVLSSTAKLLRDETTTAAAVMVSRRELARAATGLVKVATRTRIPIGPRMNAVSIKARLRKPGDAEAFAQQVYDFQKAACVKKLVGVISGE